jgi:hypothetical protein
MKGFNIVISKVMKGLVLGAALFVSVAVASASSFDEVATVNSFGDFEQKYGKRFTVNIDDKELIDNMMNVCCRQSGNIFEGLPICSRYDDSSINILISLNILNELVSNCYGALVPFTDGRYVHTNKGEVLCTSLVIFSTQHPNLASHTNHARFNQLKDKVGVLALGIIDIGNLFYYGNRFSNITMQTTDITIRKPTRDVTIKCFEVTNVQRDNNKQSDSLSAWVENFSDTSLSHDVELDDFLCSAPKLSEFTD